MARAATRFTLYANGTMSAIGFLPSLLLYPFVSICLFFFSELYSSPWHPVTIRHQFCFVGHQSILCPAVWKLEIKMGDLLTIQYRSVPPPFPTKTLYLSPHTHIHSTSFRAVHCTFYREKGKTKTPRSESILSLNECVLSYKNSAISGQHGRQDNGQDEELQQQSIAEQQQHHQPTSVVSDRCR